MNDEHPRHVNDEDRLRELLRDPRWSLAPWPDADARVRRAARRRRRAVVRGAVAVIMTAAAASVLPALLHSSPARVSAGKQPPGAGRTSHPERSRSSPFPASVTPTRPPSIPPVGSAGFPVSIYPAPRKPRMATGVLALCPDPAGLEDPGPYTAAAARADLRLLGRGLAKTLRVSDRSAWPFLASGWNTILTYARTPVRFAGPLQPGRGMPAGLRHAVTAGCGTRVARATWVVSVRPSRRRAHQADMLFVTRRGHMLFYGIV